MTEDRKDASDLFPQGEITEFEDSGEMGRIRHASDAVENAANRINKIAAAFDKYGLRANLTKLDIMDLIKGDKDAVSVKVEIDYPKTRSE